MEPDECHVKAAHEETDCEQPEALRLECLRSASLLPCGMAAPGFGAAALFSRSPMASGTISIDIAPRTNMVECQLSSRFCSSDANGTMAN